MAIIAVPIIVEVNDSMVPKGQTVVGVWRPRTLLIHAAEHTTSAVD
jgi:hypothetical protein